MVRARLRAAPALLLALHFALSCASTHDAELPAARADAPPPSSSTPTVDRTQPSARLDIVDETVAPAGDIVDLLAPLAVDVEARARRVVGTLSGPLDRGEKNAVETSLGNFASDAMRTEIATIVGRPIDVCFQNMGGLRRNLDTGPVTEGDLVEVMPFDNAIVVFELEGAALVTLLHRVAERRDPASGARFRRDGKFAIDVVVGDAPVDDAATYVVCTSDYVFEGGGDYPLQAAANVVYTGVLVRDTFIAAFEDAAREGRAISPVVDGRVTE